MQSTRVVINPYGALLAGQIVTGDRSIESLLQRSCGDVALLPVEPSLLDSNHSSTGYVVRHYGRGIEFTRNVPERPDLPLALRVLQGHGEFIYWAIGLEHTEDAARTGTQVAATIRPDTSSGGLSGGLDKIVSVRWDGMGNADGSSAVIKYGKSQLKATYDQAWLTLMLRVIGTGAKLMWFAASQSAQDIEV